MSSIKRLVIIGVIIVILLTCLSCTESPLVPNNGSDGYNVYFHAEDNPEKWYTYNPETDKLDSVILPTPFSYRTAISPTGDRLYLDRFYGSGLLVIDLENRELITELPDDARNLALSPDGGMLAFGYTDLNLVNTSDWSVHYSSGSVALWKTTFSRDGSYLFGAYGEGYGWATVDDPATVEELLISPYSGPTTGGRILTSLQSDHWYLFSRPFFFVDWDPGFDSAVFVDSAYYNTSHYNHHITPDGKYVAYPSDRVSYTRYTELRIYDTELQELVDDVETIIYHGSGDTTYYYINEMSITPDSKWLVGVTHQPSGYLLVYNFEELRIERFVKIPGEQRFFSPVCQTAQ